VISLKGFDYELAKGLIASYPEKNRSGARLFVVDRKTGKFQHRIFRDLLEYLNPGDLLVLNDTKVLAARLFGQKSTGGRVEALLLKPLTATDWEILLKPSGRVKKGMAISFGENGVRLEGEILDEPDGKTGVRRIRFESSGFQEKLNRLGRIPLPPYLGRPDEELDREFYQTVFAQKEGAIASPTAGLHFDEELLQALRQKGIEICFVTLHVSYGTFHPVQTEDLSQHEMHEEEFEITGESADQIARALKENRKIVACGTTVVRVLETLGKPIHSAKGKTRLFIYPPYKFKLVDILITNFHLPRTTLLILVSAFAGRDLVFRAYEEAVRQKYRFYSYGDAMVIL